MQDERGADQKPEVEPFSEDVEVDPTEAVEKAEPYFPPTNPVIRVTDRGETKVAGGFGSGDVRKSHVHAALEDVPSDEGLEDTIHRELRHDASTAHLHLHVSVKEGVVRLQGVVEDEMDAESALAVAGSLPAVVEVIDEMERGSS